MNIDPIHEKKKGAEILAAYESEQLNEKIEAETPFDPKNGPQPSHFPEKLLPPDYRPATKEKIAEIIGNQLLSKPMPPTLDSLIKLGIVEAAALLNAMSVSTVGHLQRKNLK